MLPWRAALLAPAACYGASFVFPAFHVKPGFYPGVEFHSSAEVLAWGWLGPLAGNFGWYANPFFFWSLFSAIRNRHRSAVITSIIATVLSLFAFVVTEWSSPGIAGVWGVTSLGTGAYMWLIAIWLQFILCVARYLAESSNNRLQGDAKARA